MSTNVIKTVICFICIVYSCIANANKIDDNWVDFTLFDNNDIQFINKHMPKKIVIESFTYQLNGEEHTFPRHVYRDIQLASLPNELNGIQYEVSNFYITPGEDSNVGQFLNGNRAGGSKNTSLKQMSLNVKADRKSSTKVVYDLFGNPLGSLLSSNNVTFGHYPDQSICVPVSGNNPPPGSGQNPGVPCTITQPGNPNPESGVESTTIGTLHFGLMGTLDFSVAGEGNNKDQTAIYTCDKIMIAQGSSGLNNNWWFGGNYSYWTHTVKVLGLSKNTETVVSLCTRTAVAYSDKNIPKNHTILMPVIFIRGSLNFTPLDTNVNQVKFMPGFNQFCTTDQKQNIFIPVIQGILDSLLSEQYQQLQDLLNKIHNIDASAVLGSKICTNNLLRQQITAEIAKKIAEKFNLDANQEKILAQALNNNLCNNWDPDKVSEIIATTLAQVIADAYCG